MPSPGTGVLQEILVQEGETVDVGTVLARIGPAERLRRGAGHGARAAAGLRRPRSPCRARAQSRPSRACGRAATRARSRRRRRRPAGNGASTGERQTFVSPVVARIAAEHGIDPATVAGTGRDGRVTKKDILAFVEWARRRATPAATPAPSRSRPPTAPAGPLPHHRHSSHPTAAPAQPATAPASQPAPGRGRASTLEPMTAMRRGIAEHMRRSLDTAAHVTSAIEVDMSKVVAIRQKLKARVRGLARRQPDLPRLHRPRDRRDAARVAVRERRDPRRVDRDPTSYVNLGFAVALEDGKGLIVPVLKNAEGLNLLGMARGIADLAERARTKKLLPDDVQGGTFTITNPGSYGTFIGTPIINQPQSAILGTYAVVKRPWVITDDAGRTRSRSAR